MKISPAEPVVRVSHMDRRAGPAHQAGAQTGSTIVKMLQRISRDPSASHDPCGSSFLLVYELKLASPDAFLQASGNTSVFSLPG